jgi:hypothetical protein
MARGEDPHCTFCVLIFRFHPFNLVYVSCISHDGHCTLNHFDEVMNHCDLSCSVLYMFLPYVFLHTAYIIYHYLMVQVISSKWCARVLATLPLMSLRLLASVVVQHPSDLVGSLLRPHRRQRRLHHL